MPKTSFRPTRMHRILDVDAYQPFIFRGLICFVNESGQLRVKNNGTIVFKTDQIKTLREILENQGEIERTVGASKAQLDILKGFLSAGMQYLIYDGDAFYLTSRSALNQISLKTSENLRDCNYYTKNEANAFGLEKAFSDIHVTRYSLLHTQLGEILSRLCISGPYEHLVIDLKIFVADEEKPASTAKD